MMSEALVIREADVEPESWSDPVRGEAGFRTIFGGATPTADFAVGVTDLETGGWYAFAVGSFKEIAYRFTAQQ